uniref:Uncharacterized protein n=1 Tax=Corvus moneduloides TaxID=1196302 RepID=A0A8U7NPH8_CORMO
MCCPGPATLPPPGWSSFPGNAPRPTLPELQERLDIAPRHWVGLLGCLCRDRILRNPCQDMTSVVREMLRGWSCQRLNTGNTGTAGKHREYGHVNTGNTGTANTGNMGTASKHREYGHGKPREYGHGRQTPGVRARPANPGSAGTAGKPRECGHGRQTPGVRARPANPGNAGTAGKPRERGHGRQTPGTRARPANPGNAGTAGKPRECGHGRQTPGTRARRPQNGSGEKDLLQGWNCRQPQGEGAARMPLPKQCLKGLQN